MPLDGKRLSEHGEGGGEGGGGGAGSDNKGGSCGGGKPGHKGPRTNMTTRPSSIPRRVTGEPNEEEGEGRGVVAPAAPAGVAPAGTGLVDPRRHAAVEDEQYLVPPSQYGLEQKAHRECTELLIPFLYEVLAEKNLKKVGITRKNTGEIEFSTILAKAREELERKGLFVLADPSDCIETPTDKGPSICGIGTYVPSGEPSPPPHPLSLYILLPLLLRYTNHVISIQSARQRLLVY